MHSSLLVASILLAATLSRTAEEPPPAKVEVAPVRTIAMQPRIEVLGAVRAIRHVELGAEVGGLVVQLGVEEGERVEPGAPLAVLDTELRAIALEQAEAERELARQQLAEYQAGARPEEVRQAEARVTEARARLAEAERDLQRVRDLRVTEFSSEKELTVAVAAFETAQAVLAQREAERDLVAAGPRAELKARAAAEVNLRAAKVKEIERQIEKATVRAPFGGVVTEKHAEVGAFILPGASVVTLLQIDPAEVIIDVPEPAVARVRSGIEVQVRIDALPGELFTATVEALVPAADPVSRTFPVRLSLGNPEGRLLPGMTARAVLPLGDGAAGSRVLAVPLDALVRGPDGIVVHRVRDGRAEPVTVTLGAEQGGMVEVRGALGEGDLVAVRGNERIGAGQAVEVVGGGQRP